jgi:hypothetical protein
VRAGGSPAQAAGVSFASGTDLLRDYARGVGAKAYRTGMAIHSCRMVSPP